MKQTSKPAFVAEPIANRNKNGEARAYVRLLLAGKAQRVSGDWFRVELLQAILGHTEAVQAAIASAVADRDAMEGEQSPKPASAPVVDPSQLADMLGALGIDPAALAALTAGGGKVNQVSSGNGSKPAKDSGSTALASRVRNRARKN